MCRAVLESEGYQSAAEGINDGIMYLMIFPYLLMAGVAYFIWRSRRKNRASRINLVFPFHILFRKLFEICNISSICKSNG